MPGKPGFSTAYNLSIDAITYHTMLFWPSDLVLGIVVERVEILVALMAVIMLIRVPLVLLHELLGIKGHIAVLVRALETPDGLEYGRHHG
jgi:hypothetical protein